MSLDAGRVSAPTAVAYDSGLFTEPTVYERWKDWEPSRIAHHAKMCCEIAREWIVDIDYSSLNGGHVHTGPRWLRHRFEWGPGTYPIHWCELVKKSMLDCGVLAALAHEVFTNRGVRCLRIQLVQSFSAEASAQWLTAWKDADAVTAWLDGEHIYHEGVAIFASDNTLKLWDSSAGWWIDPKMTSGYGSVTAVRISSHRDEELQWGEHVLKANEWGVL